MCVCVCFTCTYLCMIQRNSLLPSILNTLWCANCRMLFSFILIRILVFEVLYKIHAAIQWEFNYSAAMCYCAWVSIHLCVCYDLLDSMNTLYNLLNSIFCNCYHYLNGSTCFGWKLGQSYARWNGWIWDAHFEDCIHT